MSFTSPSNDSPAEQDFVEYTQADHALNILMVLMALEWFVGDRATATGRVERVASLLELTSARRGEIGADELLDELAGSVSFAGIHPDDLLHVVDGKVIAEALLRFTDEQLER
jgi:hypothetical protein